MEELFVKFTTAKDIQQFVKTITPLSGDFELVSDGFLLDARSLMGVFSLDWTKPILLKVYNPTPATLTALAPFATGKEN